MSTSSMAFEVGSRIALTYRFQRALGYKGDAGRGSGALDLTDDLLESQRTTARTTGYGGHIRPNTVGAHHQLNKGFKKRGFWAASRGGGGKATPKKKSCISF